MNDYLALHELYHHGIKGQRWGFRRYQNPDGTLTAEGKARYNADKFENMNEANKVKYQTDIDNKVRGQIDSAGNVAKGVKDVTDSARQIVVSQGHVERGTYPNMTDKELQDSINRLSLEQRYSDLRGETKYIKSGGEKAKEILQTVGAVAGIGLSLITIMKAFYDMRHPATKTGKSK